MKKLLLILIPFIFAIDLSAQNEANNWFFGNKAGITFIGSQAMAVPGELVSSEGCASISDEWGNLLFYSNGEKVWDRNHQVMPNGTGLLGSNNTTQSCIIIPRPGYRNKYYIFTLDDLGGTDGLRYCEVDMSLRSGLGDITSVKNYSLTDKTYAEKLTAVRHSNGTDYWILVHEVNNSIFSAFQITSTGPATTPVTSNVGSDHPSGSGTVGYMKFSPNGKKVACAVGGTERFVELFDFDATNGKLNNALHMDYSLVTPYGIEFSPDSKKLYVSTGNQIYQYGIPTSSSSTLLVASQKEILSDSKNWGLQLGPDKKIYVAKQGGAISVIKYPNADAPSCYFSDKTFNLGMGRNSIQGMPNFIQNLFSQDYFEMTGNCAGQPSAFSLNLNGLDSVKWSFGDNTAGQANFSTSFNPSFTYSAAGVYAVSLTVYKYNYSETFMSAVTVIAPPAVNLGNDTIMCKGQALFLTPQFPGAGFRWNDGSTAKYLKITQPGNYFVDITLNSCTARDSINVGFDNIKASYTINNLTQCLKGNSFELKSTTPGSLASLWLPTGLTPFMGKNVTVSFNAAGTPKIKLIETSTNGCKDSVEKEVTINPNPQALYTIKNKDLCGSDNYIEFENASSGGDNYSITFDNTDTHPFSGTSFTKGFSSFGNHPVTITAKNNLGCEDIYTSTVSVSPDPDAAFTVSSSGRCANANRFMFKRDAAKQTNDKYAWFVNGSLMSAADNYIISFPTSGKRTIKLEVTNDAGCKASFEKEIEVFENPVADFSTTANSISCLGKNVQFKNLTHPIGSATQYTWTFDDATTSNDFEPLKIYTSASLHTVTLEVTDENNCESKAVKYISTFEKPKANFTVVSTKHCLSDNLFELVSTSDSKGAAITSMTWVTPETTKLNDNPVYFTFTTAGERSVKLILKTEDGCLDSAEQKVTVLDNPKVSFTINKTEQCQNDNRFELLAAFDNPATISSYKWEVSGNTIYDKDKDLKEWFSLYTAGTFPVEFTAHDANGCESKVLQNISIFPVPDVNFIAMEGCEKQAFTLINKSQVKGANVSEWKWTLSDGSTWFSAQPNAIFDKPGKYDATLTATTDKGCIVKYKVSNAVTVNPQPSIDFDFRKIDWNFDQVTALFTSKTNLPIETYKWNFGNGKTDNAATPSVVFDKPGNYYTVSLELSTFKGCKNSLTKEMTIAPPFEAYVPTSFTPNGDGKNDMFGMEGVQNVKSYNMLIFNRWGQDIFESNSTSFQWDGTFNSTPLPTDMYSYQIKITDLDGREYLLKGNVHLIR